jgi:hypothetical protein
MHWSRDMSNEIRPLVNLDFARALRAAALADGYDALVATVDRAIARDVDAANAVGAIMHGATWSACPACRGGGRIRRRKCAACSGCGEDAAFPQRRVDAVRAVAFEAL